MIGEVCRKQVQSLKPYGISYPVAVIALASFERGRVVGQLMSV